MKRDAEAHAEEDRRRREEVELRNQADSLAYAAEKTVREAGDKIPADVRSEIEAAVSDLRSSLGGEASADTIRSQVARLNEALQKAGSAVYSQDGAQAGAAPQPEGESPAEEGTVEGEYREV